MYHFPIHFLLSRLSSPRAASKMRKAPVLDTLGPHFPSSLKRNDMSTDYLTLIEHSFRYSPKTGRVHWKMPLHGGRRVHLRRCPTGIYQIQAGYDYLPAQNVVWFLVHGMWPTAPVRHLNGNRLDNRRENLACP